MISSLDHFVLTVKDIARTCDFYNGVLGMKVIDFQQNRKALKFGKQKINLHEAGKEFEPKAHAPTPGSADLCFITELPLTAVLEHFHQKEVQVIEGPVQRTGALGRITSLYIRDPDGNLIEISNYTNVQE
ncbi:VOC family protein [Fictibacillus sp. KIGAM418]|uniref:VOC family protein n=1 Tax=Fictibacillus marinisediminis TaxID=2878389 RepID=A0A9X2BFU9_9BACL|nr:VOC family protein [Fictibacillus marinisediminis]MCK6259165.1 VOC family protein [Fictibacillus marinisediminis]